LLGPVFGILFCFCFCPLPPSPPDSCSPNTQEPLNFLLFGLSLASCIRQKKEKVGN
jgi:hypothetical protein